MTQNAASAIANGLEMVQCTSCKTRHHLQRKDLHHHLQSIAARSSTPSTVVDKATAEKILADRKKDRKKDHKKAKKTNHLPAASTVSTAPDTSKPKATKPKAPRTTPRYSFQQPEVPELISEPLPAGWQNPEPLHSGAFAGLAGIQL